MIFSLGHRGAAGVQPENTLKGFRYALNLGIDAVECDVHLTRDDHLVVIHDDTVDRTTNGSGAVRNMRLAQLRRLDAGQGERIPTLDEVLDLVIGRAKLFCELKGEGVVDAVVDTVLAQKAQEKVIFISAVFGRLERVRQRGDHFTIGTIAGEGQLADFERSAEISAFGVGVHYKNICLKTVDQARALGLGIRAWNPDTLWEQQAMVGLRIDGIGTNRPDILVPYLRIMNAFL